MDSGRKYVIPRYHPHSDLARYKANTLLTFNGVCRARLFVKITLTVQAPKGNASFSRMRAHTYRPLSEKRLENALTSSMLLYYYTLRIIISRFFHFSKSFFEYFIKNRALKIVIYHQIRKFRSGRVPKRQPPGLSLSREYQP